MKQNTTQELVHMSDISYSQIKQLKKWEVFFETYPADFNFTFFLKNEEDIARKFEGQTNVTDIETVS